MAGDSKTFNGENDMPSFQKTDGANDPVNNSGVDFAKASQDGGEAGTEIASEEGARSTDEQEVVRGFVNDYHDKQSGSVTGGSGSDQQGSGSTDGMHWYSVYVQAGCEGKVIDALKHRISKSPLGKMFGEILLPKISESGDESKAKKIMPGYIFIQMQMTDDTWELVRTTPKVLGFIGGYKNPPPIPEEEIRRLKEIVESKGEVLKDRIKFVEGDVVTINEGPFKDFIGKVVQIDEERSKLTVEITIFGRQTPVQVDYSQVTKR